MGNKLMRSRLYYQKGDFNKAGQWVDFDKDFLKWAAKLFRDFKKTFLVKYETQQADYATKLFVEQYENHKLDHIELGL